MSKEIQVVEKNSIFKAMASIWNVAEVDPKKLHETLKATAFKPVKKGEGFIQVTDDQLLALMIVSKQYSLNPFLKEIYAFPAKDGSIVPVVSVDGWSNIINSHPQFKSIEFRYSNDIKTMDGAKPCPEWIECIIERSDRSKPVVIREYLDECYQAAKYGGPWQTHTKRFLRHKAMIQCGRVAFSFAGIYDNDEAGRIMQDVTPVQKNSTAVRDINAIISTPSQVTDHDPETGEVYEATVAENATVENDLPSRAAAMYAKITAGAEKGDSEEFNALLEEMMGAGDTSSIGMLQEALKG